jgi:hypothetical protein
MTTIEKQESDVGWDDVLDATTEQVWDAITRRSASWLWPVSYEPRVGGAERGLTTAGGVVTAWERERRFATRAERPDGWWNEVSFELQPAGDRTQVRYLHRTVLTPIEYEQCVEHTDVYHQTLVAYVAHFAGRDARYETVETDTPFAEVARKLGAEPEHGVVDYRAAHFLGLRTPNELVRVFGRDVWGLPVEIVRHRFETGPDAVWLDAVIADA